MKEIRFYKDKEGEIQATMAKSEKPEDELCDFCSGQHKPYKVYKCRDFAGANMPQLNSSGDWNACPKCAELINENDREGLVDRCAIVMEIEGIPGSLESLRIIQEQFFNNRI